MVQNVSQIHSGIMRNIDARVKNIIHVEKNYVLNPAICNCENWKYLASIIDDSINICDEVIELYDEEMKTIPTNFNEQKVTCNRQKFYILLALLLITALLIAVSI